MSFLTALRDFALLSNPKTIPPSNLLRFSDTTITIFDKFPKAKYHFLILPRVNTEAGLTTTALHDLRSLLTLEKSKVLAVLKDLAEESKGVEAMIVDEMEKANGPGSAWKVFSGFHAVPSMHHVHLHVISSDYVSGSLKNKKHWNSFNPKLGFFIHLQDVLDWFELPEKGYKEKAQLPESKYEPLLKTDLNCWKCGADLANMPKLKTHLQGHLQSHLAKHKAAMTKKRKHEIDLTGEDSDGAGPAPKKKETGS